MELIELIKKLRSIKADAGYTRESKAFILKNGRGKNAEVVFFAREIISGIFRSGWSMALTAALLLLTISSFSVLKILHPVTSAVVDVTGLRAEAQAIDAQIELTGIQYAATGLENKTSTQSMAIAAPVKSAMKPAKTPRISVSTQSTSTPPTIDYVLDALSQ